MLKIAGRLLSSQTIGVEFSSRIIKVGTGARRKRIKLQLWDTAGTERFRSVSRSYYRGAAGAILVYDLSSMPSFKSLPTFLNDARALASSNLTVLLAGNKFDLASGYSPNNIALGGPSITPKHRFNFTSVSEGESSVNARRPSSCHSSINYDVGSQLTVTIAPDGREVALAEASQWASRVSIPVSVEVSAYTGEGVEELFTRLAAMILTKIEIGEIDPSDPMSGIQYGDGGDMEDGGSISSLGTHGRKGRAKNVARGTWGSGMREWEAVFQPHGDGRPRKNGCC